MDLAIVRKKIAGGFLNLTFRKAALLAINYLTINLILARILPVSTIGIFNIANSILAFFTFFSDIGLAAALIQKKDIENTDISTTFATQEILAITITLIIFLAAPLFADFYHLDESGMWLIRSLAIGFFLVSLKVVPSVLLERDLKFQPLVWVEIIETLVFNSLLIFLTYAHFSVAAFSWGVLARSVVGVITIYLIAPWQVSLGFSKESLKTLINFGLPFQLNSLLALLKDRLVPLVIARMVGAAGVGYITWSQSIAFLPLEVMNIMIRVTFPAFSRLQSDENHLRHTLEDSIFLTSLFLYPMLFGLDAVAPSLITHVVSSKWQPALPLVYLFSLGAFWATFSSPFTNFLNAIGKIRITLKLMIMWTVLEWLLTPLMTYLFGFIGVGIAAALISFSSIIPLIIVKRLISFRMITNIWPPLVSAILMAGVTYLLSQMFTTNFISLLVVILIGIIIYLSLIYFLAKDRLLHYWQNYN